MPEQPQYLQQQWPITRQFDRVAIEAPLQVSSEKTSVRGWCCDLSEGGMGATLAASFNIGECVTLSCELPSLPEPVRVQAVVRHAQGFRYGFEFITITPEQLDAIRHFARLNPPRSARAR